MSMIRVMGAALGAVAKTSVRRISKGPQLPSWSFGTEVGLQVQRAVMDVFSELEPATARALMEKVIPEPKPQTGEGAVTKRPGELGGVPVVRFETPGSRHAGPHVLYFHGGGYVLGSTKTHAGLTTAIARGTGGCVTSVDYRLAPEHPHPAPLEDGLACYRALLESGAAPGQIVLAGDSAGGNLSAALLLALRDAGDPLPAGAVLLCPWVDLSNSGDSFERNADTDMLSARSADVWSSAFRGEADAKDPVVSPLYAGLQGLPPLLVFGGAAEVLVDQIEAFASRAVAAGVDVDIEIVEQMFHDWMLQDAVPQARPAIERICGFVQKRAA